MTRKTPLPKMGRPLAQLVLALDGEPLAVNSVVTARVTVGRIESVRRFVIFFACTKPNAGFFSVRMKNTAISSAAAALGRVSSAAKTAAARQNGQLGGRPAQPKVDIYDADETHGDRYRRIATRMLDRSGSIPLIRFGGRVHEVKRVDGMWVLGRSR